VLLAVVLGYCFTYEPAPEVRVRWRDGVTPKRQEALERQFRLVNRNAVGDRFSYDLLDTRQRNVEALLRERDVDDTDRIDRQRIRVRPDAPYGQSWMWVAHRLPLLRIAGVVESVVAGCVLVLAVSVAVLMKKRPGFFRRRVPEAS